MGQTSDGIQPSSDKTEGVYYKMFLFHTFQFQLFGKYGLHQGFQLYNFGNSLLICSSKYFFSVEQIICNILQTTLKVKTMQHTMAEEQIRLQMGFNLHQTTLKVEVTLQTLQEEEVILQLRLNIPVCTTKCFYLICSSSSYLLNMDDIKDFNYIILATDCQSVVQNIFPFGTNYL